MVEYTYDETKKSANFHPKINMSFYLTQTDKNWLVFASPS